MIIERNIARMWSSLKADSYAALQKISANGQRVIFLVSRPRYSAVLSPMAISAAG